MFRRFQKFRTDLTRPYVKALEARSIPHVLVGGKSFHDREEIGPRMLAKVAKRTGLRPEDL